MLETPIKTRLPYYLLAPIWLIEQNKSMWLVTPRIRTMWGEKEEEEAAAGEWNTCIIRREGLFFSPRRFLCKTMSTRIFVAQNFQNIWVSLPKKKKKVQKWKYDEANSMPGLHKEIQSRGSMKTSALTPPSSLPPPLLSLFSLHLKSKMCAARWHGKHVKLMGYFYPASKKKKTSCSRRRHRERESIYKSLAWR